MGCTRTKKMAAKIGNFVPRTWILLSSLITIATSPSREYHGCKNTNYFKAGDAGVIPCDFIDCTVFWTIGTEDVSIVNIQSPQRKKGGTGYLSGEYDVLMDGSLVIRQVGFKHNQSYTANVNSNSKTRTYTVQVEVFDLPNPSYPVINEETNIRQHSLAVTGRTGKLSCTFHNIGRLVSLEWITMNPGVEMDNNVTENVPIGDGTFNVSLTSNFTVRDDDACEVTLFCRTRSRYLGMLPFPIQESSIRLQFEGPPPEEKVTRTPTTLSDTTIGSPSNEPIANDGFSPSTIPIIDGCYSRPYNCSLNVGRNGTLTCSVKNTIDEYVQKMEWNLQNCTNPLWFQRVGHAVNQDTVNGCNLTVSDIHFTVKTSLMSMCSVSCTVSWSNGTMTTSEALLTYGECDSSERGEDGTTSPAAVLTEKTHTDRNDIPSEHGEDSTTSSVIVLTSGNNPPCSKYDVSYIAVSLQTLNLISVIVVFGLSYMTYKNLRQVGEQLHQLRVDQGGLLH